MAYTKPAVALLLAGASARVGLAAQDNWNAPFPDYTGAAIATVGIVTATGATTSLAITYTTNGSKCVACIRAGNIWCASKYLLETTGAVADPVTFASGVATYVAISATQDRGQCCTAYANRISQGQALDVAAFATQNKFVCIARYTNDGGSTLGDGAGTPAAGTATAAAENVAASQNWWCSSGRNNQAANATVVQSIKSYVPNVATSNAGGNGDPRTELMLTNCRQNSTTCGGAAAIAAMAAVGTGAATQTRTILRSAMAAYEKCTFIHASEKGAPTFKADIGATGEPVLASTWDLHYSEYNSGTVSQPTQSTALLYYPGTTWANLMARKYSTAQYTGLIEMPSVWMFAVQATSGAGAGQKRWFPVQLAQDQIALQKSRNTAYSGLLTTYNTAKATYDAAVTPSTTKPDFFANLFNPPKKTAVPLRPAPPTQPADYAGPYQAPFPATSSSYTSGPASQATTTAVAASQFVVSGAHGGWGAWTMGLLAHAAMPVQKSFGVFGWAVDNGTYKAEAFSFTQDWRDMCITPAAAGSNGFCPTTTPALTAATVKSILVVSIWSNDSAAPTFNAGTGGSSLKIVFNLSNWAQNAAAWAKPARPAAAVAPATPAGAKALAASAAAAVAVAAALY